MRVGRNYVLLHVILLRLFRVIPLRLLHTIITELLAIKFTCVQGLTIACKYNPLALETLYTSHAHRYRFLTQPAVRTGLLWKIPLKGASGLKTPHFA